MWARATAPFDAADVAEFRFAEASMPVVSQTLCFARCDVSTYVTWLHPQFNSTILLHLMHLFQPLH